MPFRPASLALLACLLVAGCSGGGPASLGGGGGGEGGGGSGEGASVEGVVVTAAIAPLPDATVALVPGGRTATTDARGAFRFAGVEDGDYFLTVTHDGYLAAQTTVEVDAGKPPALVQIVMDADRAVSPYVESYSYQGFLEVSFLVGPLAGSAAGILNEASLSTSYTVASRLPDWVQAEMVWSPTQALATNMLLTLSPQNGSAVQTIAATANGPSPLAVSVDRLQLQEWEVEGGQPLAVSAFVGNNTPEPAPAAGLAAQQPFEFFTHLFYGYAPPDGWRFTADGTPQPPA